MVDPHLSQETLEHYVLGALPPEALAAVEAHAAGCARCAAALQAEARLELSLLEVGARSLRVPPAPRWRRRVLPLSSWAGAFAATLVLVLVGHRGPESARRSPPPRLEVVGCAADGHLDECVARAHFVGLMVRWPTQAAEVPRYEDLPDMAPEGPAFLPLESVHDADP